MTKQTPLTLNSWVLINTFFEILHSPNQPTLKEVGKTSPISSLSKSKVLEYTQQTRVMEYCKEWLTEHDFYLHMKLEDEQDAKLKRLSLVVTNHICGLKGSGQFSLEKPLKNLNPWLNPFYWTKKRWTINIDQIQNRDGYTAVSTQIWFWRHYSECFHVSHRTGNRTGTSYVPSLVFTDLLACHRNKADINIGIDPAFNQKLFLSLISWTLQRAESWSIRSRWMESNSVKINYAGPKQTTLLACGWIVQWKDGSSGHQYCDPPKHCGFISKGKEADFIKTKFYLWSHHRILIFEWHPLGEHRTRNSTNTVGNLILGNFIKTHRMSPNTCLSLWPFWPSTYAISATTAIPIFWWPVPSHCSLLITPFFATILCPPLHSGNPHSGYLHYLFFYKYLTEGEKKYLRSTFSKYVSPAIVDEILKDPEYNWADET